PPEDVGSSVPSLLSLTARGPSAANVCCEARRVSAAGRPRHRVFERVYSGEESPFAPSRRTMSNNGRDTRRTDGRTYMLNRNRIPPEEVAAYAGQHVAFNDEGTQIVACGAEPEDVWTMLQELGIDAGRVVLEYIP